MAKSHRNVGADAMPTPESLAKMMSDIASAFEYDKHLARDVAFSNLVFASRGPGQAMFSFTSGTVSSRRMHRETALKERGNCRKSAPRFQWGGCIEPGFTDMLVLSCGQRVGATA